MQFYMQERKPITVQYANKLHDIFGVSFIQYRTMGDLIKL